MTTSAKRAVAACALLAGTALSTPALAQTAFPPTKDNISGMGVDLKRGSYTYSHADISTGNGPAVRALALTRIHNSEFSAYQGAFGPGTTHNYDIKLYETTEAGQTVIVLLEGFSARKFTLSGSTYTPQAHDGTTLEKLPLTGSTYYYKFTARDGTRTSLVPGLPCTTSFGLCYYAFTIISPKDGTIFLSYDGGSGAIRLRSVISSIGRALYFGYASSSSTTVASVTAVNLAQTNCSAFCTPPAGLPQVTYSYTNGRLTGFANTLGKTTTYGYDPNGRLQSVQSPTSTSGPLLSTAYDGAGRVSSQTWSGKTWNYSFTPGTGEIAQATTTDPLGGVTTTHFGSLPAPDAVTDAESNTTGFGYDQYNRLTSTTLPSGGVTALQYDDRGNVTKTTSKAGSQVSPPPPDRITTFTFDATCSNALTCNQPTAITNALGTTTLTYDPSSGHLAKVTSPPAVAGAPQAEVRYAYTARQPYVTSSNGPTTQIAAGTNTLLLNPIPMLTSISRCSTSAPSACPGAADEITTTFSYGPTSGVNNLDMTGSVEDVSGMALASAFTYDAVGNVLTAQGPYPGGADLTTNQYDGERRLVQTTGPDPDGSGPLLAPVTVNGYDDDGRLVRTAQQRGSQWLVSCTRYSEAGLVVRQWGAAETGSSTTCPAEADPVSITDYAYDDVGRPSTVTQRLTAAQGGDRVSATEYFKTGWVKKVRQAVGAPGLEQDYQTFTYTPDGLPATVKDARGNLTTYEYSGFDELRTLRYPDKTNGGASSATDAESYHYDQNGNLDKLTQRDGSVIGFGYDALDRVITKDVPETDRDVSYAYDLLGRMTAASLPGANAPLSVTWSYDKLDRVLASTSMGRTIGHAYAPDLTSATMTFPDGKTASQSFDDLGRTTEIVGLEERVGSDFRQPILADYSYDQLSRRSAVANGNGTSTSYAYDAAGRLQSLAHDLAGTAQDVTFSLGYNQAGQITSRGFADAYAWDNALNMDRAYEANGLDQYTQAGFASPTYDARGNLAGDGKQTYAHDSENELTNVSGPTNTQLTYDAIGRLARLTSNGQVTEYGYDGDQLVAEYDGSGNLLRRYVHGPGVDEPIVWYEGAGTGDKRWLHADERGSIVAGSNASGASLFINSYGPFGEPGKVHTGTFGYTGQMRLPGVGLYYYKARYYSSQGGRFIETDPIGVAGGQNRYSYVMNDPINFIDSAGLDSGPVFAGWTPATCLECNAVGYYPPDGLGDVVITALRQPPAWWGQDLVSDNYYRNSFALSGAAAGAVIGAWLGGGGGAAGGAVLCAPGGPVAVGCGAAGGVVGAAQGGVAGGVVGGGIGGLIGTAVDYTRVLYNKASGGSGTGNRPTMSDVRSMTVRDAIRARGGSGSNVNRVATYLQDKPVEEVEALAKAGNQEAKTAMKLVGRASTYGQRY